MSKIIEIIEENNELRLAEEDAKIVCGNSNYKLKFVLGEDWQNANHKAAVFCVCGKKTTIAFADDECEVPVLHGGGVVFVSLFAGDGEVQLATTDVKIELVETFSNVDFVEFEPLRNDLANLFGAVNDIENGNIEAKKAKTAEVAEVANNVSNPNLLINGDFKVNQRGENVYNEAGKYTVDRWRLESSNAEVEKLEKGISVSNNGSSTIYFVQYLEDASYLFGQTITLSSKINNKVYTSTLTLPAAAPETNTNYGNKDFGMGSFYLKYSTTRKTFEFTFRVVSGAVINVEWAKLEIGSTATAFYPRPYAEELALCQRYFWRISPQFSYGDFCLITYISNGNKFIGTITLPQTMRINPTFTATNISELGFRSLSGTVSSLAKEQYQENQLILAVTSTEATNVVNGQSYYLRSVGARPILEFDAEIY